MKEYVKTVVNTKRRRFAALMLCAMAAVLLCFPAVVLAQQSDGGQVADPSTYAGYTNADTKDTIGQIWTDKSVYTEDVTLQSQAIQKGNSDFLVALSALSSTSNEMVSTTKPLDIVLVLDVSGSMDDELSTVTYKAVYEGDLSERSTYYILNDAGEYQKVEYYRHPRFGMSEAGWYVDNGRRANPRYVQQVPMTSAEDTQENHVQFFAEQVEGTTKKIDALKTAVNGFIDATAAENSNLPEGQDRVGNCGVTTFSRELA